MVLVILLVMVTLLLVALAAALPSVYQEGQRAREEELIFRGSEYGKAIALFHRQFGRYPVNVKELLQTNGMRFLRKEYADPMDPKGKWRFIHVNAAGVLLDSITQPTGMNRNNPNPAGLGAGGNTNTTASGNSSSFGGFNSSGFGGSSSSSFGGSSSFGSSSSFGGSSSMGFGNSNSFGSQSSFGNSGMSGSGNSFGPSSSFFGNQSGIQGGFIAGVAATNHHESIKVWNKHHRYDEWEFLGIDMGLFGIQVGMPGSAGASGSGQQTGPTGFGQGSFGSSTSSTGFGPGSN